MTARALRPWLVATLAALAVVVAAPAAGAEGEPRVSLDRPEVGPGQPVLVTVSGFDAQFVNVVLCGNLAYRGGGDCNVTAGVSKELPADGRPRVVQLIAHPPPVPCPCIVRVTSSRGETFAVAPIAITGHPVAEPEGVPDGPLVEVEVEAVRADDGFLASLRSALGGPTSYEATISVRNTTTAPLTAVALRGAVGHWLNDDAATLELQPPGTLEPGQTFTQEVVTEVPAPSVGDYSFQVVASGAGSTVSEAVGARNRPVLLYLLIALFIGDLAMVATRWMSRRRARRAVWDEEGGGGDPHDEVRWSEPVTDRPEPLPA